MPNPLSGRAPDEVQGAAPGAAPGNLTVLDWRPVPRNTLRGFVTVKVNAWHLVVSDIAVHSKGDQQWAQLPGRPLLDRDRQLVKRDGKIQYSPIIWFDDAGVRGRFSDSVCAAVAAHDGTAFAAGEP